MPSNLEPTYREALVHSWHFVVKHKILWLLGMASVVLGQFGLTNFIGRIWRLLSQGFVARDFWWLPTARWEGMHQADFVPVLLMSWLIGVLLALIALILAAGVCAEGTLIAAALSYLRTKNGLDIKKAWQKGVESIWSLLAIKVVQHVFLLAVTFLLIGLWNCLGGWGLLTTVLRALVFIGGSMLALAISVVSIFAAAYVVDKKYPLIEALHEGYGLFSEHVLVSLELCVLLLALSLTVVVVLYVGAYVATAASVFLLLLGAFSLEPMVTMIGMLFAALLFVAIAAISGGFFNAFTISVWMYCYAKMHRKGVPSRISHYLSAF